MKSWKVLLEAAGRGDDLLVREHCAPFRVKRKRPFRIAALVVLPDHIHAVWTLSTLRRDIRAGLAEPDWEIAEEPIAFGERDEDETDDG